MTNSKQKPEIGLMEISIKNFRGIKNASVGGIEKGAPWIFLTGKNGYGKTCLLQSIFIGFLGMHSDGFHIFSPNEKYKITLIRYSKKETIKTTVENKFNKNAVDKNGKLLPIHRMVLGYGTNRLSLQNSNISSDRQIKFSSPGYGLFFPDGALSNIENYLKSWYYRSESSSNFFENSSNLRSRFNNVREIFLALMPNLSDIKISYKHDQVEYFEKDNLGEQLYEPRTFDQLASGNKSIIGFVGDLIIKLFGSDNSKTDPTDIEGIVIIDELDLHLHPEWQKRLPTILSKIFPKVQFIASTHSPIPFLGAPEGSVFLKVNRTAEEGITIEKLDIDISDLTPNLILSSPIFGFTEIFPMTHKEGKRIRTEDTMEEVDESNELVKKLSSFLDSEEEKELIKLLKS